ncbi:MAG: hypothetical protein IT440_06075 [Phycisphaeraceae bacterium]|nr:hypothetical protein [Phycisphaeraceae bacterium]
MREQLDVDVTVARLLACLPEFADWTSEPLTAEAVKLLNHSSRQALMSIAVAALQRAMSDATDTSRVA